MKSPVLFSLSSVCACVTVWCMHIRITFLSITSFFCSCSCRQNDTASQSYGKFRFLFLHATLVHFFLFCFRFHNAHIKLCYGFFLLPEVIQRRLHWGMRGNPNHPAAFRGRSSETSQEGKKISCGTPTTCVFVCGGGVGAAAAVSPTATTISKWIFYASSIVREKSETKKKDVPHAGTESIFRGLGPERSCNNNNTH